MLLQEGGQGQYHLGNLTQHMETTPRLVTVAATKSRSHRHRHSRPIHHLLAEEDLSPPTQSRLTGRTNWQWYCRTQTWHPLKEKGYQYAGITKILPPTSFAVKELFPHYRDHSQTPFI